ncbi:MAG TPA: EAL domain-containing protein, partial [bacterium]|nr:EAL domain-containing protein [bacterium]
MDTSSDPGFDLGGIIEGGHLIPYFQPIVSVKNNSIVGYEGLVRGLVPGSAQTIPPLDLFAEARSQGLTLALDRLCRKQIFQMFKTIQARRPERLLSVNFEASVLDQGVQGSGHIIQQVREAGLNPQSIIIEVIESNVEEVEALERFIATYREMGFLIALDDVGAGHSNLNRIPLL